MKSVIFVSMVIAGLVSMCALTPVFAPSADGPRRVCGELPAELCEQVVAAVIDSVPVLGSSPVAVATTTDPGALSQRGGDTVVVIGFAPPSADSELWSPSVWRATRPMFTSSWRVEEWGNGRLPAHFRALMREAGLDL